MPSAFGPHQESLKSPGASPGSDSGDKMSKQGQQASRRAFLGSAAAVTLGATTLQAATATPTREWSRSTDVIVVGTGAAGLSAAIAAKRAGAEVLVVEKAASAGGTTSKS